MSVNVMGDAEPSDTFQNALLPCERGTVQGLSARRETDDVRHLKHVLFSDSGSVEYVAC
jgi:hypothetical protein